LADGISRFGAADQPIIAGAAEQRVAAAAAPDARTATLSLRIGPLVLDGTFPGFAPWALRIRALAAALCCLPWFSLFLGLYLQNSISPGSKTYAALLLVDLITAVYLGREADREERAYFARRS
jgi:hypothetical protein